MEFLIEIIAGRTRTIFKGIESDRGFARISL